MSREQRRVDRKSQRGGASPTSSRKTPIKAAGGGPPWTPILAAVGVLVVIGLLVYLIVARGGGASTSEAAKAAADQSSDIPGTFVPDQGRQHLSYTYSIASQRTPIPFCPGVKWSGAPNGQPSAAADSGTPASGTPAAATSTPVPAQTPAGATPDNGTPNTTPTVPTDCRNSNPPSSGQHYNVQNNVDIGNGNQINIPADISVYPPDVEIPRDSIPHILEHAGVFVGWNCAKGDQACLDVEKQIEKVVNDRIDVNKNRVVMAHDNDLVPGTIGMASWTRVLDFDYKDYKKSTVTDFIGKNSCRVDWEGFCQ
jgi:hypothetical protein